MATGEDFSYSRAIGKTIADTLETQMDLRAQRQAREARQAVANANLSAQQWELYAQHLQEKVQRLEADLKRQSANHVGLEAVRKLLLDELTVIADATNTESPALDPVKRKALFDEKYNEFMRGDALTF